MADKTDWVVDGFQFGTDNDARLAKNEQIRIRNLEAKLDYNNTNMVYAVYKKAIENRVFKTPVGYDFLKKLQRCLNNAAGFDGDIYDIPVQGVYSFRESTAPAVERVKASTKKKKERPKRDKEFFTKRILLCANAVLAALVVLLFLIAYKGSSNPNVLNYEKAVKDRYAYWEQQLTEREQAVREKERELMITE